MPIPKPFHSFARSKYAAALLILFLSVRPVQAENATVADTTRELLRAYSAKDLRAVEALLDREALILGSDVSERAGTPESIRDLLSADFALWQNAEFGEPTFLSERTEKELGSVACDVPFSMLRKNGRRDVVTVRFILVWRRSNGVWRLAQCFSAVPTVGQSAREILNRQNH